MAREFAKLKIFATSEGFLVLNSASEGFLLQNFWRLLTGFSALMESRTLWKVTAREAAGFSPVSLSHFS
jgi:hypothetical protein